MKPVIFVMIKYTTMKKLILFLGVIITLIITSCSSDGGNCGRLGCLPSFKVDGVIQDTGASVIMSKDNHEIGINGIVVYQAGQLVKAYDMQDPDRCTSDLNPKLRLSDDKSSLISESGEEFLLINGQPIKGISCRGLIEYNVEPLGQIFQVYN